MRNSNEPSHDIAEIPHGWPGRRGSLIDNLHVAHSRQRTGVGTALLTYAANAVAERAVGTSIYLWVLSQNTAAQRFYRALDGTCVEKSTTSPPGGVPTRLNGSPGKLRITWPDPATLLRAAAITPGQRRPGVR